MNSRLMMYGGLGILALALTGCPPKSQVKKDTKAEIDQVTPQEEPSLRGKEYQEVADLSSVFFDLDQATLRSDARDTLQKNYGALKKHADWEILVEGHCDERGTTEYNLALGQKRAKSVRDYYVRLGVPENSVGTISYGEEKPLCSEATDACWHQNRRAETKVKGK